jgi:predicted murein hydrolase (TIGR00659 family)
MTGMLDPLLSQPAFAVGATVCVYWLASELWSRCGRPALLNPVLVATAALGFMIAATGMEYETYFRQAEMLHEALGVVIVLLAVPLFRQFHLISTARAPIACALVCGSVVAVTTALLLPAATGETDALLATLAPKSSTAAVAVEVADKFGGVAGLTAVIVIATGVFGAVFGPTILRVVGVEDERAAGFALGVASHAIGTARAFQISDVAGAFASLGMILNALLTIAIVPVAMFLLR